LYITNILFFQYLHYIKYTLFRTLYNRVLKNGNHLNFCVMQKLDEFSNDFEWISNRLKELRKLKGYKNYEHFAYELGMSRSAYWRIEKGSNFEIKTLLRICKLLDISIHDFFKKDTSV
jgi:DNA-binding XRE family transcriptional regulator